MDSIVDDAPSSNLRHIYFFVEMTDGSHQNHSEHLNSSAVPQQVYSPGGTTDTSSSVSTRRSVAAKPPSLTVIGDAAHSGPSTGSPLSATAAEFVPSVAMPSASAAMPSASTAVPSASAAAPSASAAVPPDGSRSQPLVELFQTSNKGTGLRATRDIPLGTRIICEAPIFAIPRNELALAVEQYSKLGDAKKEQFNSLYHWHNESLALEHSARMILFHGPSSSDNPHRQEAILHDMIRIMSIFGTNCIQTDGGGLAVFATTSRLNHSCVPNVYHSYNPRLGMETVHTLHNIVAGEELTTNYLGADCHFWTHSQRWEVFRNSYGFTCACAACFDRSGVSDARHELFAHLVWGLEQFEGRVPQGENRFIPDSITAAVKQSKDIIRILFNEGLHGPELMRAHQLESRLRLTARSFEKALASAYNAAEVERNLYGMDVMPFENTPAHRWVAQVVQKMRDVRCNIPPWYFQWQQQLQQLQQEQQQQQAEE